MSKRPKRRKRLSVERLESRRLLASTSFEFTDTDGSFTLFDPPEQATFVGGEAKVVGNLSLYHTGAHAWMIDAGGTGTITLATPADSVRLFLRNQDASVQSTLRALDAQGNVLASIDGADNVWTELVFQRADGQNPVSMIEINNNSTTQGRYAAIDDFSFAFNAPTPLDDPIPAALPGSKLTVRLTEVSRGLIAPNLGIAAFGTAGRMLVTDQTGRLSSVDLATGQRSIVLDLSDRLVPLGISGPNSFDERGLLGVAFHPRFASNGLLYTYTSEPVSSAADFAAPGGVADHQSVIAEWQVFDPTNPETVVDVNSRRELLRIDQPQFNHDGGSLIFGFDDLLYIPLGDGGAADDQGPGHSAAGNAQDPTNVLGSLLRIDPLGNNSANGQYGIPAGNPFVGNTQGIPPETFAFGLRNPFRSSFDSVTGELLIADVGQNDIEEVNRIDVATGAGGNFGWNVKEGTFFFNDNGADPGFVTAGAPSTLPEDLIDPVLQYDHDEGIAVIGGFVYRGDRNPDLAGKYIFGDFSGRLFIGDPSDGSIHEIAANQITGQVLGFGSDADGEIYVMTNETGIPFPDNSGNATGAIWRIDVLRQIEINGSAANDQIEIVLQGETIEVRLNEQALDVAPRDLVASVTVTVAEGAEVLFDNQWQFQQAIGSSDKLARRFVHEDVSLDIVGPHDFTNPQDPFDVNGSGNVTALDALQIINELDRRLFSDGDSDPTGQIRSLTDQDLADFRFYDVSTDRRITSVDALRVINELARRASSTEPNEPIAVPSLVENRRFEILAPRPEVSIAAATSKVTGGFRQNGFSFLSIPDDPIAEPRRPTAAAAKQADAAINDFFAGADTLFNLECTCSSSRHSLHGLG